MILAAPWGLLGLLAIPLILAIHLFRRRYRPVTVTGLFLYGAPSLAPASGRRRERLRRRSSLILEILAALAATWFLCDPHLDDHERGRHLAFILDSRRSLAAVDHDGTSAIDRARTRVRALISSAGPDDRITLLRSGATPRVLAGPGANAHEALLALDTWQADAAWHSLDQSLALGLALAGDGLVILVSDREHADLPEELGFIATGKPLPTVGMADARWLRDDNGERLAIRVLAQGGDAERTLTVHAGDNLLTQQKLTLIAGQAQAITVPLTAPVPANVRVHLTEADPYRDDDQVVLHRPAARQVAWQLALSDEQQATPLRRGLAALAGAHEAKPAHLVIGDADAASGTWSLQVRNGSADPVLGPFLARRGDPVLSDVDATGVLWSGGETRVEDEALLLAGNTILLSGRRDGRDRRLTLWCDLSRSSLDEHPAWPILLANLVAARAAALPGIAEPNVPCGQALRLVVADGARSVIVSDPDGERQQLYADAQGVVLHPGLHRSGEHRVSLVATDGSETPWLSVYGHACDARLADLSPAQSLERLPHDAHTAEVERRRSPLALLLPIMICAAALVAAWAAHRREEGV